MLWGNAPITYGHETPWSNITLQGNALLPPAHWFGAPQGNATPARTPTCKAEVEGAAGSAMAVAHLAGQQPHSLLAHTQQLQAVLVVIWHRHLVRAHLLPQRLPAPVGTPAATSQPHRQPWTHCPIDSFYPTATS